MKTPACKFINEIKLHLSGGNCDIDMVVLNNGQVLGIDQECVVLYASVDDFYAGNFNETDPPTIMLKGQA